jgi:hypothetical protein
MRALKLLVVVLGVLLAGGLVALVAAIVARIERGPAAAVNAEAPPVRTALPPGSRIVATELSGDRLLVRLALADGGEALVLFNARTGAEVAVIEPRAGGSDQHR